MQALTIPQLQEKMDSGELTARTLTEYYLQRIKEIDQAGPYLNSVLIVNPDALAIADELDAERQAKGKRGPLHGIPILLKDNIDTADKMPTTAGSLALAGTIAPQDATITQKLREAGAIILGKANLSEWANFRSSRSSSGWSSLGGQVNNPYALDRNPCGSSSGSGVAVAADLCTVAIGTETDGSIVCPSSTNGIVGIKPTVGLVSRAGIIPISHTQDTAGPMARTVTDATAVLSTLVGIDERDEATSKSKGKYRNDYAQFLDPDGLKGKRIGVARNFFGKQEKVDQLMEEAIEIMRQAGAEIIDNANIETLQEIGAHEHEVLYYEIKADMAAYLATRGETVDIHSLADIIEFNKANRAQTMPYFEQEHMEKANAKGDLSEETYLTALAEAFRLAATEGIDATLQKHNLDAIVAPSNSPAWPTDWINGDNYSISSSTPAAVAGYPNITVPAGYIFGLPVGISFFSTAFQEPTLIKMAYAFEQLTKFRQEPKYHERVQFK